MVKDILWAAKENGLERIHWTGGEPTLFKERDENIITMVQYAMDLGYTNQVMTTNGSIFYYIAKDLVDAGLTRVNISLDSLDQERNRLLTGRQHLGRTLRSIEDAVKEFPSVTKINVVAMRDVLTELPSIVDYAKRVIDKGGAQGSIAIKLIEICPNNPAQLQEEGERFYLEQVVGREELFATMDSIGTLTKLDERKIEGDNPNCNYYSIGNTGISVGLVTMPSLGWPCGQDYFHKLRITPYGGAAICIQEPIHTLHNKSRSEMLRIIADLKDDRKDLDFIKPNRIHFREQLGEMRFGDLDGSYKVKPIEHYIRPCKKV